METRASSPDQALVLIKGRFGFGERLEPLGKDFELRTRAIVIEGTTVTRAHKTGYDLAMPWTDRLSILLPIQGASIFVSRRGELIAGAGRGILVSDEPLIAYRSRERESAAMSIKSCVVVDALGAILGEKGFRVPLGSHLIEHGHPASQGLIAVMAYLARSLEQARPLPNKTGFVAHCRDLVLWELARLLPAFEQTRAAPPQIVRRASEHIRAHAADIVSLTEVAEALGVSLRAIQLGFRQHYGMSPRDFLRDCRLEAARARLCCPEANDCVTSIAFEMGFGSLSRFAERYRHRYGERPAETLAAHYG